MNKPALNLDLKEILKSLRRSEMIVEKYLPIMAFVLIFGIYGFLILQISKATQKDVVTTTSQAETIKRLKIDQASIDKIQKLEDQNVSVKSLFESARNNPFQE